MPDETNPEGESYQPSPEEVNSAEEHMTKKEAAMSETRERQNESEKNIENLPEIIRQNQDLYDWLGIRINLQQELEKGNIALPTAEQIAEAKKEGYSLGIIVPKMPRASLLNIVKDKFANEFPRIEKRGLPSVHYTGGYGARTYFPEPTYSRIGIEVAARDDLDRTESQLEPSRPDSHYLCHVRPLDSEPEIAEKTAQAASEELNERRQNNPKVNLRGLTLEEDLLRASLRQMTLGREDKHDSDAQKKRFEPKYWLLAETVQKPKGVGFVVKDSGEIVCWGPQGKGMEKMGKQEGESYIKPPVCFRVVWWGRGGEHIELAPVMVDHPYFKAKARLVVVPK